MRIVKAAALAAMAAIVAMAPAGAARERAWMGVGTHSLGADTASHIYRVSGTNIAREIMFCVDGGGGVQLVSAELRFRGGENQALQLRTRVRAGACSRVYNLRNRTAELDEVTLTYDPASLGGAPAPVQVLVR